MTTSGQATFDLAAELAVAGLPAGGVARSRADGMREHDDHRALPRRSTGGEGRRHGVGCQPAVPRPALSPGAALDGPRRRSRRRLRRWTRCQGGAAGAGGILRRGNDANSPEVTDARAASGTVDADPASSSRPHRADRAPCARRTARPRALALVGGYWYAAFSSRDGLRRAQCCAVEFVTGQDDPQPPPPTHSSPSRHDDREARHRRRDGLERIKGLLAGQKAWFTPGLGCVVAKEKGEYGTVTAVPAGKNPYTSTPAPTMRPDVSEAIAKAFGDDLDEAGKKTLGTRAIVVLVDDGKRRSSWRVAWLRRQIRVPTRPDVAVDGRARDIVDNSCRPRASSGTRPTTWHPDHRMLYLGEHGYVADHPSRTNRGPTSVLLGLDEPPVPCHPGAQQSRRYAQPTSAPALPATRSGRRARPAPSASGARPTCGPPGLGGRGPVRLQEGQWRESSCCPQTG
jgi:hypothetical protein